MTAGRDGFRDASFGHGGGLERSLGTADCLASWIDRSHHLLLKKLTGPAESDIVIPAGGTLEDYRKLTDIPARAND